MAIRPSGGEELFEEIDIAAVFLPAGAFSR